MANRHTGSAVPQESMWQRGAVPRLSYVSWIDRCAFYEVPAAPGHFPTGTASVLPPLARSTLRIAAREQWNDQWKEMIHV